jgi:maltose alpha-D-glucosyltransferase/alpha-amylase
MQWSSDRNAGFSKGDPARLYLPLIMDPVYGYQALNVESQRDNPGSLLHWTRRMIQIRKRHPVFGTGAFTELNATNPSVLAFIREHGDDRMLCVNNLSRYPQPVELDLGRYAGVAPVECVGGVRFPEIGELPYLLTLPGHGFYWFQLPATADRESAGTNRDGVPSYGLPEAGARVHATFEASPVSAAAARTHATEHPVSTTSSIPAGFSPAFGDGARTPSRGSAVHASGPSGPAAERTGRGGGEKGNGSL